MESILLDRTIELLTRDKYNWPTTARKTGLSRSWIANLYNGWIKDPGIRRVERLYFHLATKYPNEPASRFAIILSMEASFSACAPPLPET